MRKFTYNQTVAGLHSTIELAEANALSGDPALAMQARTIIILAKTALHLVSGIADPKAFNAVKLVTLGKNDDVSDSVDTAQVLTSDES